MDRYLRKLVRLPVNEEVDFRASCFCHRRVIDMGYVCSVCLSSTVNPFASMSVCSEALTRRGRLGPFFFGIRSLLLQGPCKVRHMRVRRSCACA